MPQKLILHCHLSPGDVLTLTAAVESLHATYPGEYLTDVRTSASEIWEHNPHVTPIADDDGEATRIDCQYNSIHRSNQIHSPFLAGYTLHLAEQLKRPLTLTTNRPHVYLTDDERSNWMTQIQEHFTAGKRTPFWLVNSGVKSDYTAKQWPIEHFQEVVDRTRGRIQWVQIGAAEHRHQALRGVIDLIGQTTHRQLLRLCYHASGGLGPVTYLQHALAAFERPYICLLGGREPVTWVTYPLQQTLHTFGALECCRRDACWRSRVVPLGDGDGKDNHLCEQPIVGGFAAPFARCMGLITPELVLQHLDHFQ